MRVVSGFFARYRERPLCRSSRTELLERHGGRSLRIFGRRCGVKADSSCCECRRLRRHAAWQLVWPQRSAALSFAAERWYSFDKGGRQRPGGLHLGLRAIGVRTLIVENAGRFTPGLGQGSGSRCAAAWGSTGRRYRALRANGRALRCHAWHHRGTFIVNIRAVRRATGASRAARRAAPRAGPGTAVPEDRPPGAAVRRRAISIAIEASQNPLERTEIAVAVRAGELTVALIARIAAIGRIAFPFIAIDFTAAAAAA